MSVKYTKDFILYDVSPEQVYLTGSWCDWKPNAIKMTKIPNLYFIATVELPYNTKVAYKYIVNDNWMTNPEEQTETDAAGNTNNVFTTPSEAEAPAPVPAVGSHASGITAPLTSGSTSSAPAAGTASGETSGAAEEIQEAKTSGVPVGAAVAGSGIAAAAAEEAAAAGLGHSETDGVKGVEKVAPNVTQATSSTAGGLGSDKAKSDVGSSTHKAPLPASTADAPVAPGSATHDHEGKGLFAVIGGLGAAAAAAATKAAYDLEHKIEERFSDSGSDKARLSGAASPASTTGVLAGEGPKTATQTPAVPNTSGAIPTSNEKSASIPTVPSNERINREIAAHPDPTASAGVASSSSPVTTTAHAGSVPLTTASSTMSGSSHSKDPAAALDPIATNAGVSKITKEFAAVDFDHTKAEVVHAVEKLGSVIAGGLSGIGAAHEGRDIPVISDFWAKKGSASASSAFGKPLHDVENSIGNGSATIGQNGVTPLGGISGFSSAAAAWPATADSVAGTGGLATAAPSASAGSTAAATKDGSSTNAPTLPPVTGGPALYPSDKSAPAAIKIQDPQANPAQVRDESAKAGAHAPALNSNVGGAPNTGTVTSTGAGAASGAGATSGTGVSSGTPAMVPVSGTSSATPATGSSADAAAGAATGAAAATGASAVPNHHVTHDKHIPSVIEDVKEGLKGEKSHDPPAKDSAMYGPGLVAQHEQGGVINSDKKHPSNLGLPAEKGGLASAAAAVGGATLPPHHQPPHDKHKPSVIEDVKAGLKGEKSHDPPSDGGALYGPGLVAQHEKQGVISSDKRHPETLGVAAGAASSGPPTTPKKPAAGTSSAAGTPATPKTDGYNTAPSTPSGTPADRKRKSSFFHKIKSALSPNNK